jgi:hypothetical protein
LEGNLSPAQAEAYKKVDAMFQASLFSILADNIVDSYMTFDHSKGCTAEAKFGVADAGTESYVMEQYYDYKMTHERCVVELMRYNRLPRNLSSLSVPYRPNLRYYKASSFVEELCYFSET